MDLARELKTNKLWNIKVTVIPIVIGALGTITKWLVQGLEDFGRRVLFLFDSFESFSLKL